MTQLRTEIKQVGEGYQGRILWPDGVQCNSQIFTGTEARLDATQWVVQTLAQQRVERYQHRRKTAAALGAIALVLLSCLPSWAYRGSGRAYNPPDVGQPTSTVGTGSR